MGIKQCALATAQPTSSVHDLPNWYNAGHSPTGLCRPHLGEDIMPLDERNVLVGSELTCETLRRSEEEDSDNGT